MDLNKDRIYLIKAAGQVTQVLSAISNSYPVLGKELPLEEFIEYDGYNDITIPKVSTVKTTEDAIVFLADNMSEDEIANLYDSSLAGDIVKLGLGNSISKLIKYVWEWVDLGSWDVDTSRTPIAKVMSKSGVKVKTFKELDDADVVALVSK